MIARTLEVPGARLHYEVRGAGPLLLVMGSPMGAADFAPLAEALAGEYTVVTHDPRGISGSRLDNPRQDSTPELRADDVAALLDDLGATDADMFGSSGGAVTGLALIERQPGRVRTLVAHEPPLLKLLPDAAEQCAAVDHIVETFRREGLAAAARKFMVHAGFGDGAGGAPAEPTAQQLANSARFFGHELGVTIRYRPDIGTLKTGPSRIVVGVGAGSAGLTTYRTAAALAEVLGTTPVAFPGDHGGFLNHPKEFADVLRKTLVTGRRE